jgi:hypothetical protein
MRTCLFNVINKFYTYIQNHLMQYKHPNATENQHIMGLLIGLLMAVFYTFQYFVFYKILLRSSKCKS